MIRALSIVIPAYNEQKTIAELLDRVLALDLGKINKEIIVVNDGSTDKTREILKGFEHRVVVIDHQKNKGKGAAVRSGFARAAGEYVVVQDADLEYNPEDLKRMLHEIEKTGARVLYGSRRLPLGEQGIRRGAWYYYLGGLGVTIATNILYGTRLTDEPTCYKMIHTDVLKQFTLTQDGFEFCPEVTAKIARKHIPIQEIAIQYNPRSSKEGKKLKFKDGVIALWTLLKYRFF